MGKAAGCTPALPACTAQTASSRVASGGDTCRGQPGCTESPTSNRTTATATGRHRGTATPAPTRASGPKGLRSALHACRTRPGSSRAGGEVAPKLPTPRSAGMSRGGGARPQCCTGTSSAGSRDKRRNQRRAHEKPHEEPPCCRADLRHSKSCRKQNQTVPLRKGAHVPHGEAYARGGVLHQQSCRQGKPQPAPRSRPRRSQPLPRGWGPTTGTPLPGTPRSRRLSPSLPGRCSSASWHRPPPRDSARRTSPARGLP